MDLRKFVRSSEEEGVALLEDLVRMPSVRGKEGQVAMYLLERFSEVGEAELVPVPESIVDDPEYSFPLEGIRYEDRPNLRVRVPGSGGGRSLIVNTHMDVVPPSHGQEDPFLPKLREGAVWGRGACDAKGQIVAIYLALKALKKAGFRPAGDVTVHLVVEEECGGNGTLAFVREGEGADGVLVMEPTGLSAFPSVRGAVWFEVKVLGRSGHSAQAGKVVSALKEAIRAVELLEEYHSRLLEESRDVPLFESYSDPMPITFGTFHAGEWPATVPREAVLRGVLGFLPNRTREQVEAEMREVLSSGGGWLGEHYELRFLYRHNSSVTPPDHPLVGTLVEACRGSGWEPEVKGMPASCDAWFYRELLGVPTVVFGPGELGYAHSSEEHIKVEDLVRGAEALARFIVDWCGGQEFPLGA